LINISQEEKKYDHYYNTFTFKISFKIETTYLNPPETTEMAFYTTFPFRYEEMYKDILNKQTLANLNKIEYILACPIEDLAPHMNDPDNLDSLVAWRYLIPWPPNLKI
jgi:hypothetical protein